MIVLDTIATEARFDPKDAESDQQSKDRRVRLAELDRRFGRTWEHIGRVAGAFGAAYSEIGDLANATEWYGRAIRANDGSASLRAAEQLSNLSIRATWKSVSSVRGGLGLSKADREGLTNATANIRREIESLEGFIRMRPTMELGSLLGSAHKRLAMVSAKLGDTAAERQACADMQEAYKQAEAYGGKDNPEVFYPAWHRLVSDALAVAGTGKGLNAEDVTFYRGLLARKDEADQDFWSAVGFVELDLIQAVAAGTLANETEQLRERLRKSPNGLRRDACGARSTTTPPSSWTSIAGGCRSPRRKICDQRRHDQQELSAIDGILEALDKLARDRAHESGVDSVEASVRRTRSRQRQRGRRRRANPRVDILGRHEAATPRRHVISIQQFRLAVEPSDMRLDGFQRISCSFAIAGAGNVSHDHVCARVPARRTSRWPVMSQQLGRANAMRRTS